MKLILLVLGLLCAFQSVSSISKKCEKCYQTCDGYESGDDCFNNNYAISSGVLNLKTIVENQENTIKLMQSDIYEKYRLADADKRHVERCGIGARYNGNLTSSAFSASSWYDSLSRRTPKFARLYMPESYENDGGWLEALPYEDGDWLQVDLGEMRKVTGVVTQGQPNANAWPTSYKVQYGISEDELMDVIDIKARETKVFSANFDYHTIAIQNFPEPVQARYIRFYVLTHYSWPALRVEILEC